MVAWEIMEWAVTPWGGVAPVESTPPPESDLQPHLRLEEFDGTPIDVCIDSGTITRNLENNWRESDSVQLVIQADVPPSILTQGKIVRMVAYLGTTRLGNWGLYRITGGPEVYEDNTLALQPRFTYIAEDWLAQMLRWTIMTTSTDRMTPDNNLNVLQNVIKRAQTAAPYAAGAGVPASANAWEGVAHLCLWDITNGQIVAFGAENVTPLPPADPRAPSADPLRGLHFEPEATWMDVLGQILSPNITQRAGWTWEGCTVVYDKDGKLHLRTARRRWSQRWGFSQDDDHVNGTNLHIANYTIRPQIPAADRVQVLAPGVAPPSWAGAELQPSGTARPYWPPAVLGSSLAKTRWYTPIGNIRTLKLPLLSPALIQNYGNNGDYRYLKANAQFAAEAAMLSLLREAYQLDMTLVPTALYPELTQDISFIKQSPGGTDIIRSAFSLIHTTTTMLPMNQTWTGQWSGDL